MKALWNPYNVAQACPSLNEDLCYSATTRIKYHLDDPKIRERLGVREDTPPYQGCSEDVRIEPAIVSPGIGPSI